MKVKTPKDGPIDRLYRAAVEIVDGTRKVFAQQGHDLREVRLPILMHGRDMRVTIEAGPAVAERNAVDHAQMQASGKPAEPVVDMSSVQRDAAAIIKQSADETRGAHTINGRWRDDAEAGTYELHDALAARTQGNGRRCSMKPVDQEFTHRPEREIEALRAAITTTSAVSPEGWPQASAADNAIGWTLDYKFLEKVEALAKTRTEYSTSMEATEQVLIAAMEVLAAAPNAAPVAQGDALDAAFEAVRKRLCELQRYSFVLDDDGVVRRVQDRVGNWIEFDDAHALFDPVAVDAARAQAKEGAEAANG